MTKRKNQDIVDALAKLALLVVEQASLAEVDLSTRLDALKVGTQYLVGTSRAKAKESEDDPDASNFNTFRERLKGNPGKD